MKINPDISKEGRKTNATATRDDKIVKIASITTTNKMGMK
jgi:hypothetical protein